MILLALPVLFDSFGNYRINIDIDLSFRLIPATSLALVQICSEKAAIRARDCRDGKAL
jgi:hypothetical protein